MKNDDETKIILKESRSVRIGIGNIRIEVRPIVIKKYMQMYNQFAAAFAEVMRVAPNFDLEKFQPSDLTVLAPVLPKLMGILDDMLELDQGTIAENATIEDLSRLIIAVLDVNNIGEIKKNFRIAKGLWTQKEAAVPNATVNP